MEGSSAPPQIGITIEEAHSEISMWHGCLNIDKVLLHPYVQVNA
jgi:hypothetical protein